MKERTIFERIMLILGVVVSTIVWLLRLIIKLVQGALNSSGTETAARVGQKQDTMGTVRVFESESDVAETSETLESEEDHVHFRDVSDTVTHPEDDPDHEDNSHVHYRDVSDTVTHPEDDPDHEDNGHVHYRDVSDTVTHPEDDPDHEDNGHVHYRDVSDVVEVPDTEDPALSDELTESVAHGVPAGSTEFVADDVAVDVESLEPVRAGQSTEGASDAEPAAAAAGQGIDLDAAADAAVNSNSGMIASEDGSCPATHPVKGNASSRIYHVPEAASYENTHAEFCFANSEAAESAGYRAPKR